MSGSQTTIAWRRLLALAACGAALSHILCTLIAGWLTPGYSSLTSAISDLGSPGKPYRVLANYGAIAVPGGLLVVAAWLAARTCNPPRIGRVGAVFFGVGGGLSVVAGVLPFPSRVHLAAALGAALAGAVGVAALSTWIAARLRDDRWYLTGFLCAAILVLTASCWTYQRSDPRPRHWLFLGLQQRTASFCSVAWFAAASLALARRRD